MKRKIEIEFKVTPEEIAELFLDMTAEEQARFLMSVQVLVLRLPLIIKMLIKKKK